MVHKDTTKLLELLHCQYPIVGAPMASVSGGLLAASTTIAGGFGFIGAGYWTPEDLQREIDVAELELDRAHLRRISSKSSTGLLAIGVGFITWTLKDKPQLLELAIRAHPLAFWFSFGDYRPYVEQIRQQVPDAVIMVQVDSVEDAVTASSFGNVDILVLQGLEAGGHGPKNGSTTFCIVPEVAEILGQSGPLLLAAGGVSGWRQLVGALSLGAHGIVLGTRLCVATEALLHPKAKDMLVQAAEGSRSTITTSHIDQLRGQPWDLERYTARALKNSIFNGSPVQITPEEYCIANSRLDFNIKAVFAGMGVGAINIIEPASDIISGIVKGYYNHIQNLQQMIWVPQDRL